MVDIVIGDTFVEICRQVHAIHREGLLKIGPIDELNFRVFLVIFMG